MRISTALVILLTGFCLNSIGGCGGKRENTVIENPPMSAEENLEEENAGVNTES